MSVRKDVEIIEPRGKLGVLLVGLGAVSTTFIAGVEAVKKGIGQPVGSLTQMGTIRLGKRTDHRVPLIRISFPASSRTLCSEPGTSSKIHLMTRRCMQRA